MIGMSYVILILVFIAYYLLVLFIEKRFIQDPKDIIEKVFSIALLYAGIVIVYFTFTGKPLFDDSASDYDFYILLIGMIAIFWTLPSLLEEFSALRGFFSKTKKVFKR